MCLKVFELRVSKCLSYVSQSVCYFGGGWFSMTTSTTMSICWFVCFNVVFFSCHQSCSYSFSEYCRYSALF